MSNSYHQMWPRWQLYEVHGRTAFVSFSLCLFTKYCTDSECRPPWTDLIQILRSLSPLCSMSSCPSPSLRFGFILPSQLCPISYSYNSPSFNSKHSLWGQGSGKAGSTPLSSTPTFALSPQLQSIFLSRHFLA